MATVPLCGSLEFGSMWCQKTQSLNRIEGGAFSLTVLGQEADTRKHSGILLGEMSVCKEGEESQRRLAGPGKSSCTRQVQPGEIIG